MHFDTVSKLIAALRARRVSATELAEQAIARIEHLDGKLNAVVVRDFERARLAAKEADAALARGDTRPLLGLPMTVKESFNVAGLPTTWSSPKADRKPVERDAVAIQRLKAAGAIILGKTNVPDMLSDWQCASPVYGVTNNPWDFTRTPGGSSGGAAAALAAGFVALELGTDLAGSLRVPAVFCGIFAHKPSFDLMPMRGMTPPGAPDLSVASPIDFAVAGPMARSAEDLTLALDLLAGPDALEAKAYSLHLPAARHVRLNDYRVFILDDHPHCPTESAIKAAIDDLASSLEKRGCKIGRADPRLPDLGAIDVRYTEMLMSFFGTEIDGDAYFAMRAQADALPKEARGIDTATLRGMALSHRDWLFADWFRVRIANQWHAFFENWDVVLCPAISTLAFPHDHRPFDDRTVTIDGAAIPYGRLSAWSSVATFTGQPATAMPIGIHQGLPVGLQIIGPVLEDKTTMAFAAMVEREFGGFVPPPGLL